MSVYLYDEAIITNLRGLVNDDRITIAPAETVFRKVARADNDRIIFPLITLTRSGWSISPSRPHTMKFDGGLSRIEDEGTRFVYEQMIPIRIDYIMDIWTKDRIDNDNILRELIFYYSTHPTMHIDIPYGINNKHNFNIIFVGNVDDNSDIVDHINHGEYIRQTISFYVDDAYLWKSSSRSPTVVDTGGMYININDESIEKIGD